MARESTHNQSNAEPGAPAGTPSDRGPGGECLAPRCLVVRYHYVHDEELLPRSCSAQPAGRMAALNAGEFKEQVASLCRELEPIDWPTLYGWTQGRASIPDRCFLLTFDDGLADHARTVKPVLDEFGLHGTFFVPGAVLASHRLLAAHATHLLLSVLDEATFERDLLHFLAAAAPESNWATSVDMEAARAMYPHERPGDARLKYLITMVLPIDLRNNVIRHLFETHIGSPARWARRWYLSWDDLVGLRSGGHTIGGHGYIHEPYLRLSAAARRDDLRRSFAMLQTGLGPCIRPFSYPYGSCDDAVVSACRDTGFVHGFSTRIGWVNGSADTFRMPRVDTTQVRAAFSSEHACLQA